jgi:cytochrome c-type biogenesis protein
MDPNNIPLGLAFLAGLASFISPCVLSLVPAYVGYLGSRAVVTTGVPGEHRWATFTHGVAFVAGFSVFFIALGAAASAVGALTYNLQEPLTRIGGLVVIVFGLHTMGVIKLPFLDYDTRRQQAPDPRLGYLSSALMGVFFSAGWAPCIGPVLGAVLTMAVSGSSLNQGLVLLTAYSLGLGIPFLIAAAGLTNVSQLLRRARPYMRYISIATGLFLILIGLMLFTNTMTRFATLASVGEIQNQIDQGVINFWRWLAGGQG